MGTRETDHGARKRMRRRLEAAGYPTAYIDRVVAAKREQQHAARLATRVPAVAPRRPVRSVVTVPIVSADPEKARRIAEAEQARQARVEAETYARFALDDSRHHPTKHDPLTVGAARATGVAAKAVKRGKTLTKWQYDELEARA